MIGLDAMVLGSGFSLVAGVVWASVQLALAGKKKNQ